MSKFLSESDLERELENSFDCSEKENDICNESVSENEDEVDDIEDAELDEVSNSSDTETENDVSNSDSGLVKYVAKTGRLYVSEPPRPTRRTMANIVRGKPGLREAGKVTEIYESFQKFFTDEVVTKIVQHTNEEANRKGITETCFAEIIAFLGVLILMGANNDNCLDFHDLWSNELGRSVYIATMSRNRFSELLRIIRFDDKNTRDARRVNDKFAPLREVFQLLNNLLPKYCIAGKDTTVDEMLSLFRGKCPFKVFLKEKPGKYGMLVRILADCEYRYVHSMEVYAGKDGTTPESRGPREVVKRLIAPIKNTGRNVTTDRYYTSVELAEDLYSDYNTTLVGTMRNNRKHIPEELKTTTGRDLYSSKFAFTDPASQKPPVTLVSYIPKPQRNLIMLSSQHHDAKVMEEGEKKSDINLYYNATKGSVDTIDQMARKYTTKRSTQRWPLSMFHTLIDIACINAYTLYILNFPEWNKTKNSRRRLYLQQLGLQLIKPNVKRRTENLVGLQHNVVSSMEAVLGKKLSNKHRS